MGEILYKGRSLNTAPEDVCYENEARNMRVGDVGGKNLQNVNSIVVKKAEVYITDYLLPIGTYTISFVSDTGGGIDFYSKELSDGIIGGIACQLKENQRVSKSFTVNSPSRLCSYSNVTATLTEIQIEKGTTSSPYEPYIPSVKMLAEQNAQQNTEAMDLKMLGWTVPSECPVQNYVDGNGVFHQRVGRVDLGSLDFSKETTSSGINSYRVFIQDMFIPTDTSTIPSIYVKGYTAVSNSTNWTDKTISYDRRGKFVIVDNSYTNETTLKNAMKGVYLYYELATPITKTIDGNEVTERINDSLSVIGKCKNLLNPILQTTTQNGVTCTQNVDANGNPDGTYTINGTASADAVFELESYKSYTGKEKFRLVGCPNGGSESKYYLAFRPNNAEENRKDIGSGVTFNDLSTSNKYAVAIIVLNGTTVTNLTFKPMLCENLNATYDDFVPYTGDGETLTHDVAKINDSLNSSNRDYFISVSQSNMNMLNTDNVLLNAEKIALINTQFGITTGANRQILISAKKPTVATPLTVIGSSSWAIATIDTSGLITANTALGAGNYVIIGSFKYK